MPVTDFSHVAIGVRDMERALAFYRDVLGLRATSDETEAMPGEGGATFRRRGVYLRWSDDERASFVVLDELLDEGRSGEAKVALRDLGFHHICLRVDDLDTIVDRARAEAVTILRGPTVADTRGWGLPAGGQVKSVFLADPDGNAVQLDEIVRLAGDPA